MNSIATCIFQIAKFGREEGIANPLANEQDAERYLVKGVFGGQECLFPHHGILIEGGSFSVRNYSFLFFFKTSLSVIENRHYGIRGTDIFL